MQIFYGNTLSGFRFFSVHRPGYRSFRSEFNIRNLEKVKHRAGIAIGTLKKCWGSGLGAELMTALCEEAKNCGIEQMELEYIDGNIRAEKFYKKMGFKYYFFRFFYLAHKLIYKVINK